MTTSSNALVEANKAGNDGGVLNSEADTIVDACDNSLFKDNLALKVSQTRIPCRLQALAGHNEGCVTKVLRKELYRILLGHLCVFISTSIRREVHVTTNEVVLNATRDIFR